MISYKNFFIIVCFFCLRTVKAQDSIPHTGISGVYEVVMATATPAYHIRYFGEFGFHVTDSSSLSTQQALALYGVPSALKSYRLQNGETDSHGLLRLWVWDKPLGTGIGYAIPETIGMRMSVMMTEDIIRITDVYQMLRNKGEQYIVTEPIFDDPLRISKSNETDFFKRPAGVRENVVYGANFNHVFFQRYGYRIPGYGTVHDSTRLRTSEFTHHDFIIQVDSMQQLMYLQYALGLRAEVPVSIDGEWQKGPRATFMMEPGYTHFYQGFVSPNNICGKLKFFMPRAPKPDFSAHQRLGEHGVTMHTFYTPKVDMVYGLVKKNNLKPGNIQLNEYGERCFIFKGPEGASWQIIEKMNATQNKPAQQLRFEWLNN